MCWAMKVRSAARLIPMQSYGVAIKHFEKDGTKEQIAEIRSQTSCNSSQGRQTLSSNGYFAFADEAHCTKTKIYI